MSSNVPGDAQEADYGRWALEYSRRLRPDHFSTEAIGQATQREITVESLALVKARRREVHVFNELLVQYPRRGQRKPGQVVPDNMVVLTEQRIRAGSSYNVPLEPARPFWVLEYVSKSNERKDYEDSFVKYERELKVPYYLVFYPDDQDLTLFRHNKRRYVTVKPNKHGRYLIRDLDLELALLDGWVRFWYKGELLPLPAELQGQLDDARREIEEARRETEEMRRQVAEEKRRADELQQRLEAAERELARLRAEPGEG
jgi:Uma2 family endonuclease